jgi:hypothetical protein
LGICIYFNLTDPLLSLDARLPVSRRNGVGESAKKILRSVESMKTGVAHLPLHYGKAPSWLFQRMKCLAREITLFIIDAYGVEEMLLRLSDPFWFQAFGCALGFDWHSSGVTTTVCGALKEGTKGMQEELGFFIAGGKGRTSRKTPLEIEEICGQRGMDGAPLIYASRMSAKVDSTAVQDGYQIYHHSFFFTQSGKWAVVQQGMNEETRYARRYHWFSQGVNDFVCEPHWAVCCDQRKEGLNLVAQESEKTRQTISELSREKPEFLIFGRSILFQWRRSGWKDWRRFLPKSMIGHQRILRNFLESRGLVLKA